ncbi:NAD(P)-dependent glycerol-3-phosphate dehydrogenase [Aureimonas fodinaquatilis]|uniref:Glycerol-3-phosphate dehydrogenase [NAD(P)+] n=1 Tax=Aureimonas fodinaquatilis TaxID=2565783 RepID=A0A5B0DTD6_9HYPH|nr:NAD(P)H-dependent glycerol-3-phosphate dehydrogenase [Aureimonas fodinaquatilis]KAA0969678.1 NAD(P)-dependent glycerol-3-phosphate dehydrogenase [Aureimonas fodinaquatilis]
MTDRQVIAIIGGGAWGTALAAVAARKGHDTRLYAREQQTVEAINKRQENRAYLPGIALPPQLKATNSLEQALDGADLTLIAVPAQTLRQLTQQIKAHLQPGVPLVLCSKGIEKGTGRFISQVVAEELPDAPVAILSGPSFAMDVARGLPTAVTLAASDVELADSLAATLSSETLRIYASSDVTGVEAGGAIKNVLALAAGTIAGRGLGASAGAAVITRGFVELRRLGEALGARTETLMGLSGLGDLVLTCSSAQSRNFAYGMAVGRGEDLTALKLAEGVHSASVAARIAREHGIDAPIIQTVAEVLEGTVSLDEAIRALLTRPLKREID